MDNKPSSIQSAQSSTPEATPATPLVVPKKKFPLLLGVSIGTLVVIGVAVVLLIIITSTQKTKKNTAVIQEGPTPTPTIALKTEYSNPFDEKSQYENPFNSEETYKNPFDTSN